MSEDILERAKKADIDLMAITDWGQLRDLFGELIAEIERLRSENKIISDRAAHHDRQDAKEIELLAARIAELEAGKLMYEEIAESYQIGVDDLRAYIKRLEAAFLEATKEIVYATHEGRDAPEGEDVYAEKVARDALERIKAGGKDEA